MTCFSSLIGWFEAGLFSDEDKLRRLKTKCPIARRVFQDGLLTFLDESAEQNRNESWRVQPWKLSMASGLVAEVQVAFARYYLCIQ